MLCARCQSANQTQSSKALIFLLNLSLIFILDACQFAGQLAGDDCVPPFPFNEELTRQTADSTMKAQTGWMYADTYTRPYFQQAAHKLLWATDRGIDDRADTLMNYLKEVEGCGLKSSSFHVKEIEQELSLLRSLKPDSCEESEVCRTQGKLEYLLTEAYIRYAYGQRYGYVRAEKLFNNLLRDTPEPGRNDTTKRYRRIFDLKCDTPSDSLFTEATDALESAEELGCFLRGIQPQHTLYKELCQEYRKAKASGNKERTRLCAINIERARWRYPRPSEDKFVWVNLADFMLTAVDRTRDTVLTMRVCVGDQKHKTPLLSSRINRLDLNPYWIIPTSIIRNEIIPRHLNDSSYFSRNRIHAIGRNSGEQVNAWKLTEKDLRSGQYTLRQEKGEGNSLGRMIFRFPNDFSVYLHDTNSPGAFGASNRAVSHGCVRVQHPLDLAIFLMGEPDEFTIDQLRIAIGKHPLGERGKALIAENPDAEGMHNYNFKPGIPVYLDYYTFYPTPRDHEFREKPDSYGYDKELEKILGQF